MSESGDNLGQTAPAPGGRGTCTLADLMDPHRARGAAGMLATAIKYGYVDAFCIDYGAAKRAAFELSQSEDGRAKAAGTKLLAAMALHDLKLMELLDKSTRLDEGSPTDRPKVEVEFVNRIGGGE
jgi:hypothetical protein